MFSKFLLDFKPSNQGIRKVLGDLEADIMEAIWIRNEAVSVREIYEQLRLKRSIAYTTVMTVMTRLADKGLLSKQSSGNAYVYSPVCTKDDFSKGIVREVIDGLLTDFAEPAVAHFVDKMAHEDAEKMDALEALIQSKRQKGEK